MRSAIFPASFAFRASFRWHYSTLISVCGESDESSIHSHHLSNLICYLSFFHSFVHVFVILPEQSVTFRRIFRNPQRFLRSTKPVQHAKTLLRKRIFRKRFARKKVEAHIMSASAFSFLGDSVLVASAGANSPAAAQIKRQKHPPRRANGRGGRKAPPYGSYDHRIALTVPPAFSS